MPIGHLCRACGAALPADLRWCTACYAPTTAFAAPILVVGLMAALARWNDL